MITSGAKFNVKLLYELDYITIDIKPPSSHAETPTEFISWCMEDQQLREKVEFKMVVDNTSDDINFARMQIQQLRHFKRDITIQPLYWSEAEARADKREVEKMGGGPDAQYWHAQSFMNPKTWKSYAEFAEEFMDTISYENLRVLPQLHKIYWPGRLSGI